LKPGPIYLTPWKLQQQGRQVELEGWIMRVMGSYDLEELGMDWTRKRLK
jgi:hypothetical protein